MPRTLAARPVSLSQSWVGVSVTRTGGRDATLRYLGRWIRRRVASDKTDVDLSQGGRLTVHVTDCAGGFQVAFDHLAVPGFRPFVSLLGFGARPGGWSNNDGVERSAMRGTTAPPDFSATRPASSPRCHIDTRQIAYSSLSYEPFPHKGRVFDVGSSSRSRSVTPFKVSITFAAAMSRAL